MMDDMSRRDPSVDMALDDDLMDEIEMEEAGASDGDAATGAAIGGIGGAATGAIAGALAGPMAALIGAVVGGVVGAAASGAAVAAVDQMDDDDTVSGFHPSEPMLADANHGDDDEYDDPLENELDEMPMGQPMPGYGSSNSAVAVTGNRVPGVHIDGRTDLDMPEARMEMEEDAETEAGTHKPELGRTA